MIVFRWIMSVLLAVTAGGSALCFVLFMLLDVEVWIGRARSLRHWAYVTALFWFNSEIWGRVIYTLFHWG